MPRHPCGRPIVAVPLAFSASKGLRITGTFDGCVLLVADTDGTADLTVSGGGVERTFTIPLTRLQP